MRITRSLRPWIRWSNGNRRNLKGLDYLIELQDELQVMLAEHGVDSAGLKPMLADWITLYAVYGLNDVNGRIEEIHAFTSNIIEMENIFDIPYFDPKTLVSDDEIQVAIDRLLESIAMMEDLLDVVNRVKNLVIEVWAGLLGAMPQTAGDGEKGDVAFSMRRIDLIAQIHKTVEAVACAPFENINQSPPLFAALRRRLAANLLKATSQAAPLEGAHPSARMKWPTDDNSTEPETIVDSYLSGTPLHDLFYQMEKISVPMNLRLQHQFVAAGAEFDENDVLEAFLAADLPAVEQGDRSVVVIDRDGGLVRRIAALQCFAGGRRLHNRIRIVDPFDPIIQSRLNFFDIGKQRLAGHSEPKRKQIMNSLLPLYEFMLKPLFSANAMTERQGALLRHCVRLLLHVPGANALTLLEMMIEGSEKGFAEYIAMLDTESRRFFASEFLSPEFRQVRGEVYFRISRILQNGEFHRLFTQPDSNLDLFTDMTEGKVILINASGRRNSGVGNAILGRFALAAVTMAAQERIFLLESHRKPTIVYANGADEYFDGRISVILSQLRRYNVGVLLAQHDLQKPTASMLDALAANTAVKFVGGLAEAELPSAANLLGWISAVPDRHWAQSYSVRLGGTNGPPIQVAVPRQSLDSLPRMSPEQLGVLLEKIGADNARTVPRAKEASEPQSGEPAAAGGEDKGPPGAGEPSAPSSGLNSDSQ